jgi:NAD(P)-dependent dehydrogenase (short-subunit alcohol dehydrogenase family)
MSAATSEAAVGVRLRGKVAIATGGAGGIGRGIVDAFVREGARVLFVDVNRAAGEQAAAELGDAARFLHRDVSEPGAAAEVAAAAVREFGGVHVLVNVAQTSRQAPLVEHTQEMFDLAFNSGFFATVRLMQACYPHLRETKGSVINFGSGAGIEGGPTQGSYAAAKEAIRGLSRVAANEWAADGIRVNVLSPIAATPGVLQWSQSDPTGYAAMVRRIPLGRLGDPASDIAPVAVFLASDDSRYVTGQTLMVDGGAVKVR